MDFSVLPEKICVSICLHFPMLYENLNQAAKKQSGEEARGKNARARFFKMRQMPERVTPYAAPDSRGARSKSPPMRFKKTRCQATPCFLLPGGKSHYVKQNAGAADDEGDYRHRHSDSIGHLPF